MVWRSNNCAYSGNKRLTEVWLAMLRMKNTAAINEANLHRHRQVKHHGQHKGDNQHAVSRLKLKALRISQSPIFSATEIRMAASTAKECWRPGRRHQQNQQQQHRMHHGYRALPPLLILVAVRATAPVAGMPPKMAPPYWQCPDLISS
jgi:hypothetical protein